MKDLTDALAAARAGGDSFAMANCIRALSMDAVEAAVVTGVTEHGDDFVLSVKKDPEA